MIYAVVTEELPPRALPSVSPASLVTEVRAAVLEAFKEPGEPDSVSVSVSFNGAALAGDKLLSEYGVKTNSLIYAEFRP